MDKSEKPRKEPETLSLPEITSSPATKPSSSLTTPTLTKFSPTLRKVSPVSADDFLGLKPKPLSFAAQEPLTVNVASTGNSSFNDSELEDVPLDSNDNTHPLFVSSPPPRQSSPTIPDPSSEPAVIKILSSDLKAPILKRKFDPSKILSDEQKLKAEMENNNSANGESSKGNGKEEDIQEEKYDGKKSPLGGKTGPDSKALPNLKEAKPLDPIILEFQLLAQHTNDDDPCYEKIMKGKVALEAALKLAAPKELMEARGQIIDFKKITEQLQTTVQRQHEQLKAKSNDKEYSRADVEGYHTQIEQLKKELNEARKNTASAKNNEGLLKKCQARGKEQEEKIEVLEVEKKRFHKNVFRDPETEDLEAGIEKLKEAAKNSDAEHIAEVARLSADLAKERDKIAALTKKSKNAGDLESEKTNLKAEVEQLKNNDRGNTRNNDGLQKENPELRAKIQGLEDAAKKIITEDDSEKRNEAAKSALQDRIDDLEKELKQLKENRHIVTNEECTKHVQEATVYLNRSIDSLREDIAEREAAAFTVNNTISDLQKEVESLKQDLQDAYKKTLTEAEFDEKDKDKETELQEQIENLREQLERSETGAVVQAMGLNNQMAGLKRELAENELLGALETGANGLLTPEQCRKKNEEEINYFKGAASKLQRELDAIKKNLAASRKQSGSSSQDGKKLLTEEERKDKNEEEISALKYEVKLSQQELDTTEKNIAASRKKAGSDSSSSSRNSKKLLTEEEKEIDSLKAQITQLQQELGATKKNLAASSKQPSHESHDGEKLLPEEECTEKNRIKFKRLQDEIARLRNNLDTERAPAAARPATDVDQSKTSRQRVSELETELEKFKDHARALERELKARHLLPKESDDLEKSNKEREELEKELENLKAENEITNHNYRLVSRIADKWEKAMVAAEQREINALEAEQNASVAILHAQALVSEQEDMIIEQRKRIQQMIKDHMKDIKSHTDKSDNEKLKDCHEKKDKLQLANIDLENQLIAAKDNEAEAIQKLEDLKRACNQEAERLKAEIEDLNAEIGDLQVENGTMDEELDKLRNKIDLLENGPTKASGSANAFALQKGNQELELLKKKLRESQEKANKLRKQRDNAKKVAADIVDSRAQTDTLYANACREIDEYKRQLEALRDQIRRTDALTRALQRLLKQHNIPGPKEEPEPLEDTPEHPSKVQGTPPASTLEVEIAIERARTEFNYVIQNRAQTGLVDGDLAKAIALIQEVLDMVSLMEKTEENAKYQADAYLMSFLVYYYSDNPIQAQQDLELADQWRLHLKFQGDRSAVSDWMGFKAAGLDLPPVARTPQGYGGCCKKPKRSRSASTTSSQNSTKRVKKSKKSRGKEKAINEFDGNKEEKEEKPKPEGDANSTSETAGPSGTQ